MKQYNEANKYDVRDLKKDCPPTLVIVLRVKLGDSILLYGRSGCGKLSLAKMMVGLTKGLSYKGTMQPEKLHG